MRCDVGRVVGLQVLLVQPAELLYVETRGGAIHVADIKQRDHVLAREDFPVAMRPAEPHEIVEQRVRQVAVVAILHHADRAVALAEFLPVRAEDHRQVRETRYRGAERLVDVDLARRVVDVVVAADHVGDAHVDVVDDHREVVGRETVRTEDHEVVEFGVAPLDAALDLVVEHDCARGRIAEADHAVGIVAQRFVAIAVVAVVARLLAARHRRGAHRLDLLLRLVRVIRLAGLEQILGRLPVTIHAQGLVERALVRGEAEPVHALDDRIDRHLGRTLAIGILDAQDEFTAAMPRLQPAVQRGARTADVQETGGTRGETGADSHRQAWRRETGALA